MLEIDIWLKVFAQRIQNVFGERIAFLGIQGSMGRGEGTENSDIDVVVILDRLSYPDLVAYDEAISTLPDREKICGFISGLDEITNWDRADLFQFCHDTTPIYGSLELLEKSISNDDIRRAAHRGACDIYHMCVHNSVHEKSSEILRSLYKSSFFVLQAKLFLECGIYYKRRSELFEVLEGTDMEVLKALMSGELELARSSRLLMEWSSGLIQEFRPSSLA